MSTHMEVTQNAKRLNRSYVRVKRLFDISLTLVISPFLVLVGCIIALLIRLDSKGSIVFSQKRVGLNGVEFSMLKFRTMHEHSDDHIHRIAVAEYINGQSLSDDAHAPYKLTRDLRITKVGRLLRKTSLDELPQFWNVLRGEMSLVGPRPPLSYELELYSSHDRLRLSGKPGLTGSWQVFGRNQVTFQEMVEMDIDYFQKQSLLKDMKLIILTLPVMLRGKGV